MFRTACLFAVVALCAATAPPRISLELSSVTLPSGNNLNLHHTSFTSHDYAQECEASNTETGANCKFPIARAYDSEDGEIVVRSEIRLLDNEGVETNTMVSQHACQDHVSTVACVAGASTSPVDAQTLVNPITTLSAIKTRSTYLFEFNAKDSAGNTAEQVTFALVLNDITAPTFNGGRTDGMIEYGSASAVLTEVASLNCQDNVDGADHLVESVTVSDFTGSSGFGCGADMMDENTRKRCSEAGTNAIAYNAAAPTIAVSASCNDHAGIYGQGGVSNAATIGWTLTLQDTTAPVLYVTDAETHECKRGETLVPLTATTCYDNTRTVEWAHTMQTVTPSATHTTEMTVVGTTDQPTVKSVTYSCDDTHGNDATAITRAYTITDTISPTITVTYSAETAEICNGCKTRHQSTDSVVHMISPHGTDVNAMMQACCQGTIDGTSCVPDFRLAHAGTTTGTTCAAQISGATTHWTCDDSSCNIDDRFADFHIHDLLTVTDQCSDDFTFNSEWVTAFNPEVPGVYVRKYTVTDQSSNTAHAHVNIKLQDPDAPLIQMIGCERSIIMSADMQEVGCYLEKQASTQMQYEDPGASCHDFVDGSLSHAVEVSGQVVDMKRVGTYIINYNCQDLSGNSAAAQPRTVIIYDTTPPDITLTGAAVNYVEAGFPFTDQGATCSDSLDGSIDVTTTSAIETNGDACAQCTTFNAALVSGASATAEAKSSGAGASGTVYVVTYACQDAVANVAVPVTRTIVVKDTLPPVITLHESTASGGARLSHDIVNHESKGFGTYPRPNTEGVAVPNEYNPAAMAENTRVVGSTTPGGNSNIESIANGYTHLKHDGNTLPLQNSLMAETSSVNGWLIAAVASAVAGVALLSVSSKRSNQVMVPV